MNREDLGRYLYSFAIRARVVECAWEDLDERMRESYRSVAVAADAQKTEMRAKGLVVPC